MEPNVTSKMTLRSINTGNIEKYGYSKELTYSDTSFRGHQTGIAVAILDNNETRDIHANFLSKSLGDDDTRNELLMELLEDKDICLDSESITQLDEHHNLVERTVYYMPYDVVTHSRYLPTVDNRNIENIHDMYYEATVELLLVEEGLSRYITISFETKNMSVMDLVNDFFDAEDSDEFLQAGIRWQTVKESEFDEAGYVLDFYDYYGHKYNLIFSSAERLRDAIVSMRLIRLMPYNIEGDDNEEKA